eukprot:symbB.v1.2.021041.t1/scaffold1797.1/size100932/8
MAKTSRLSTGAAHVCLLCLLILLGNVLLDCPRAFARKHVFPVSLRELRQRIQGDLSHQEYKSTLASLQAAYEREMIKWGRRRKWEKALGCLQEMKDNDFQPGVPAFSAAIRACCEKVKQWQRGLGLLGEIKEREMIPDEEAFQYVMSGCAKDRAWQFSIDALREMLSWVLSGKCGKRLVLQLSLGQGTGIRGKKAAFMEALNACRYGGLWQDAIDIIEVMEYTEIDPATEGFNKAMDACLVANEDDWFDVMEDKAASRGYEIEI